MYKPTYSVAISVILLVGACTTQIGAEEDNGSNADAGTNNDISNADGGQSPDAEPAFQGPCGEAGSDSHIETNGSCFEYFFSEETWIGARLKCQALSGDLARVDDNLTANVLSSIVPNAFPEAWLLGTDANSEGQWNWAGPAVSYTQWRSGEPNNGGGNENCMLMISNEGGSWDDRTCTATLSYICQRTASGQ